MNKKVLGVAMVVVFCITWWIVAKEAALWNYIEGWDLPFIEWPLKAHLCGIGAGLLADVLLLVGVVAWQKITFKP